MRVAFAELTKKTGVPARQAGEGTVPTNPLTADTPIREETTRNSAPPTDPSFSLNPGAEKNGTS